MPGSHRCPPDRPAAAGRLVVSYCSPASFAADVTFDGATDVHPQGVAVQSDGKVVLSVTVDGVSGLVRFNSNGTLDDTFGVDGRTFNTLGVTNSSITVVARPDGKLVSVAATGGNFAASVYTSDGTPDISTALGYDALNRLQTFSRGTLAVGSGGTPTGLSNVTRTQGWNLDTLGNWSKSTTDGATSTRGHNKQNQITSGVGGTIAYDAAGNTTQDGSGLTMTFDAWNRLSHAAGAGGTLDIGTNDLIIPNADLDTVHKLVANGRHGNNTTTGRGKWDGVGIKSASVATNNNTVSTERFAIGVIRNGDLLTNKYSTFDGQAVNDDSILVKYTYAGDANLNGVIDAQDDDYPTASGWLGGDFNYDGAVNSTDTALQSANSSLGTLGAPSVNVTSISGTITRGQTTTLAAGTVPLVVDATSLSVGSGGTLDVGTQDLIVRGGNRQTIENLVANGRGGGSGGLWTGTGITSSAAAADSSHRSLAVAKVGTGSGELDITSFDGVSVSAGDVVVKYTFLGDVNLSGVVDGTDLSIYYDHANESPGTSGASARWVVADVNYSGSVDGTDLTLIYDNFNQSDAPARSRYEVGSLSVAASMTVSLPSPTKVVATITDLNLSPEANETYSYDATGRRIVEDNTAAFGGDKNDVFYSAAWQAVQENRNGTPKFSTVYSPVYVNAVVVRDDLTASSSAKGRRVYVLHDANFNTTAIVGRSGSTTWGGILERYQQGPYGGTEALDPNGVLRAGTFHHLLNVFQGGRTDAATHLVNFQRRDYAEWLGRWVQQDPAAFIDGSNVYQAISGAPVDLTDWLGLCDCLPPVRGPNVYHTKVRRVVTTNIGITPQQQGDVDKWIDGADEIDAYKNLGDTMKSVAQGAYHGGLIGAGREMWKDKVQRMGEDTLKDVALQNNSDSIKAAVNGLAQSYQGMLGYYVWLEYDFDVCVTDKFVGGQPVGHWERQGPNWVQFTDGAGNDIDLLAFGGGARLKNGLKKDGGPKPDPIKLGKAIKDLEDSN